MTTGKINQTFTADIAKVDQVAVANIAAINGVTWASTSDNPYNGVISQSCMFDISSTTKLQRTVGTPTDAKLGTLSTWVKRSSLATSRQGIFYHGAAAGTGQMLVVEFLSDDLRLLFTGTGSEALLTDAKLRDCSGWYHIVVAIDTSQATASNRCNLYINGDLITDFSTEVYPTLNTNKFNSGAIQQVGTDLSNYMDGYQAETIWVDGQQLAASDFGETSDGVWVPKTYAGTYGDQGFRLDYADSAAFGDDESGNTNDLTATNLGTDHQSLDNPENNHCTLDYNVKRSTLTDLNEGGLNPTQGGAAYTAIFGTFPMKTGKWYWELDCNGDYQWFSMGIAGAGEESGYIVGNNDRLGTATMAESYAIDGQPGVWNILHNGVYTGDDNLDAPATNAIIMVAFDADANKIWFGSNGTWGDFGATGVGDPANGNNPAFDSSDGIDSDLYDYVPGIAVYQNTSLLINFGQKAFTYTAPTGFNALSSENLTEPTVRDPQDDYINVITWAGNSTNPRSLTGVGFQSDLVWIKNRDASDSHPVTDSVRGAEKAIFTDGAFPENTQHPNGYLTSFDADGFSVTTGSTNDHFVNNSGEDYVAWCLKKQTGFFDIASFTGTGVAHAENHNLGVTPELIINKNLTDSVDWRVYHFAAQNKTDPETDYGTLSTTAAWVDNATLWNDTKPTSTQFTVGTANSTNGSGDSIIMYLFASLEGVSKVFQYEGNGNADGPYIYCGFRPKFVITKASDSVGNWGLWDVERSTINPITTELYPNTSSADVTVANMVDAYANGFKPRTSARLNTNGVNYVGVAFADQPFKYANARQ